MRRFIAMSIMAAWLPAAGCDRGVGDAATPAPAPAASPAAPATRPSSPPATPPASGTVSAPAAAPASRPAWQPSDNPKIARFVGLVGNKPATWIEHPPQNPMQATNYTVPGRDGAEAAHIVVFYFGAGQGGSIEANIDRWQTQFEPDENADLVEPQISRFEADGLPVTLVELAGSWMKMGATWFTPDQLFITAIVESPKGNVFIRFAGDTATVEHNRPEFVNMVRSLRRDGDD